MTSGLQRIGKRFTSKKNAGDQLSFGPKLPLQFLIKLRNLTQWEGLKEGVARECVVSGTARNGKVARGTHAQVTGGRRIATSPGAGGGRGGTWHCGRPLKKKNKKARTHTHTHTKTPRFLGPELAP